MKKHETRVNQTQAYVDANNNVTITYNASIAKELKDNNLKCVLFTQRETNKCQTILGVSKTDVDTLKLLHANGHNLIIKTTDMSEYKKIILMCKMLKNNDVPIPTWLITKDDLGDYKNDSN